MVKKRSPVRRSRSIANRSGKRRSISPWNRFVTRHYKSIKSQHPRLKMGDIMKRISKMYQGGNKKRSVTKRRSSPRRSVRRSGKRSIRRSSPRRSTRRSSPQSKKNNYEFKANWAAANTIY